MTDYVLGVIAFLVIPLFNLAAVIAALVLANSWLRRYVLPNAGKLAALETRLNALEHRIGLAKDAE